MEEFLKNKKFEAIKYRHEDQSRLLQFISNLENQLYGGFLTIQLAFGGFLAQVKIEDLFAKVGLFIIDITISFVCIKLLYNYYRRRKEVAETIKNCNAALGFDEKDVYLKDKIINASSLFRPSFLWFSIGLIATVIGIFLILFVSKK